MTKLVSATGDAVKDARATYHFVCGELRDGIDYGIDANLYNKCFEAIGSDYRVQDTVTIRKFADDFYAEHTRIYGHAKPKRD